MTLVDESGSLKEAPVQEKKITRMIYRRNRKKGFNWTLRKGGRRLSKTNSNLNVISNFKSGLIFKLGKTSSEISISKPDTLSSQTNNSVGGQKTVGCDEKTKETEELVNSNEKFVECLNEVSATLPHLKNVKADVMDLISVNHPSSSNTSLNSELLKKQKPEQKKLLFHYEIMQKCLNKKILHKALRGDNNEFKCPMCSYRSSRPYAQYLMLHLKSHSDLTPVFELYQNFGGSFDNHTEEKSSNELNEESQVESKPLRRRRKRIFTIAKGESNAMTTSNKFSKRSKLTSDVSCDGKNSTANNVTTESHPSSVTAKNTVLRRKYVRRAIELDKRRRRRRKIVSFQINSQKQDVFSPSGSVGRGRPFISHIQGLDPELCKTLQEEIKNKVTEQNPHSCRFCGKIFYRGTGIYAHYFNKHTKYSTPLKIPLDQEHFNSEGSTSALAAVNSSKCRRREMNNSGNDDDQSILKELEDNLNTLLEMLIRDHEVLQGLGWPNRNVSDLIFDILERCGLQPASQNAKNLSTLQCLQKNVRQLFAFCIKESAMEQYGWNKKLIEDVVRDLIAANCF